MIQSTRRCAIRIIRFLSILLKSPVYFGRSPRRVPEGSLILLPYMENRLSCGLTGIVAFTGRHKPDDAFTYSAIEQIDANLDQMTSNGYSHCESLTTNAFSDQYLGGEEIVCRTIENIRSLKQNSSFFTLFSKQYAHEQLNKIFQRLDTLVALENKAFTEQMGHLSSDRFEVMSGRLEKLKDGAWCISREILANMDNVRRLLGNTEPTASAVSIGRQINAVLNSIDRLEVRGRDSAGISLLFVVDDEIHETLAAGSLGHEFEKRVNKEVLSNNSISTHSINGRSALTLTYKVAAEIGSLGDNISFLRKQINNDPVLTALLSASHISFTILAHTRWASVGAINEANCHPVDNRTCTAVSDDIGVIHVCLNGDIDNYQSLMSDHNKNGIRYSDEITCDTKIIPVQIEHYVRYGHSIEDAFRLAVNDFEGSHAISMHTDLAPGRIFLALKGSGQAIFVGLAPDHYMPTSEVYGFVEETSRFLKMDGETIHQNADGVPVFGQICILDQSRNGELDGISAMFYDGTHIDFSPADIRQTQLISRDIDRQDFNHYFLKEISEAPASVRKTLANRWKIIDEDNDSRYELTLDGSSIPERVKTALTGNQISQILFIGQGTAGVAALACANLMRYYMKDPSIRIEAMKASELSGFTLHDDQCADLSHTLLVPISQSGTTADTNRTVDMVRKKGAMVVSIVNRRDSDLTFKSDGVIYTSSGRDIEMSVASTKAFYSQIIAGALLGLYVAQISGKQSRAFVSSEIKQMIQVPDLMESVLSMSKQIRTSAQRLALQRTYWAVVGSGPNKAAADEIRIKLSELCYKTISSDYVEDKKHIDLSSEPLIIVCAAGTRRSVLSDIVKDTAIFKSHKALPVVITDMHEDRFASYAEDVFHVPPISEHLAPILNTLVGHIWGYYAALSINDGSRFLHDFREDLHQMIQEYTEQEYDIFEIALEETFREKILCFYRELRKREFENRMPSTMGIQSATDLVLLLKYLAGRLPVTDFEFDFGVKGTAKNMVAMLFESLGGAINALARPVDAIKHQAKTVTVGTSRIEEKTEGLLFDVLAKKGFGIEQLTITNVMVLRNLQKIISEIRGSTLYRVSGINLLGEPTEKSTISVIEKEGTSADISSRSETDKSLKGTKRIIVRQGNVYIGKGRKDSRSILIIPVISNDPSRPNMVEHLLLLEIGFLTEVDLTTRIRALGGKYEHIKNIVQETSMSWDDTYINLIPTDELFGRSAEKVAEMIMEKRS